MEKKLELQDSHLFRTVINPWVFALENFKKDPLLMKSGWAAAPLGWIWGNFFWVRAFHLRKIRRPNIDNNDRWAQERWLGRVNDEPVYIPSNVSSHVDYVPNKSINKYSGCGDSWSMCNPGYVRGMSYDHINAFGQHNICVPRWSRSFILKNNYSGLNCYQFISQR